MNTRTIMTTVVLAMAVTVQADIPRPDAIVFGTLTVGETTVGADENYTVVARVSGFDDPVAVYRMGDNPTAGDHYILHIPQAFEADGVTPSVLKPVAGAIAEIHVVDPEGQSVLAGSVEIPVSGTTLAYDVSLTAQDEPAGQTLNETSGTNCGAGTCGAVGVVCPLLLMCGLVHMRIRRRW